MAAHLSTQLYYKVALLLKTAPFVYRLLVKYQYNPMASIIHGRSKTRPKLSPKKGGLDGQGWNFLQNIDLLELFLSPNRQNLYKIHKVPIVTAHVYPDYVRRKFVFHGLCESGWTLRVIGPSQPLPDEIISEGQCSTSSDWSASVEDSEIPNVFSAKQSSARLITVQANKTLVHVGPQDADGCKYWPCDFSFYYFQKKIPSLLFAPAPTIQMSWAKMFG